MVKGSLRPGVKRFKTVQMGRKSHGTAKRVSSRRARPTTFAQVR